MKGIIGACIGILSVAAAADLDKRPAARVHVRYVDGIPTRFTSNLAHVVELNFTLNFNHTEGKRAIDAMLSRIASDYALGPESAFTVRKFVGPGSGTAVGLPTTPFTLEDLQAADVIVDNNISNFTDFQAKSASLAAAFEAAVRGGKSVLSFHGTEQGETGWKFFLQDFFPLAWKGHGNQLPLPIYRNERERNHLVLEGVLADSTQPMTVAMGKDSAGNEIRRAGVPTRMIKTENNRYGLNLLSDPRYAPLTTCLLRLDLGSLSESEMPMQYRYDGGNPYSFILKVGQGRSAYFPFGHDNSELSVGKTSFDGGLGDFERIYAQMLFFLAGYKAEPCGGAVDCAGLSVADSSDHLTGERFSAGTPIAVPRGPSSGFRNGSANRAFLADLKGRIVACHNGPGDPMAGFRSSGLAPGVYFLGMRIGAARTEVRRIVITPLLP